MTTETRLETEMVTQILDKAIQVGTTSVVFYPLIKKQFTYKEATKVIEFLQLIGFNIVIVDDRYYTTTQGGVPFKVSL